MKPTFGINEFVRRQTADSPFSHYAGCLEDLLKLAEENFDKRKTAYRDGVINIPVPAEGFFSPVVMLEEGMEMSAEYVARREGETPRMNVRAKGQKTPAIACELDFYRKDVLAENNEATTQADWELVNFRAMAFENEPIKPGTLMHNHFGSDGGTATNMTPEEFEVALRESFEFWKDKALVG
jgi:hypothetical protein